MEEQKLPEEKNNAGLSDEQISALRDMGTIRETNQESGHNRLTDFEQQGPVKKDIAMQDPIVKDGQLVYVNDKQIHAGQDLIDALVELYTNELQLYGFEVFGNADAHLEQESGDTVSKEASPGLDR